MGPVLVYRRRSLDAREHIYSAAQEAWVQNVPFEILQEMVEQILVSEGGVGSEVKRRPPGVRRIRFGEVCQGQPELQYFCIFEMQQYHDHDTGKWSWFVETLELSSRIAECVTI